MQARIAELEKDREKLQAKCDALAAAASRVSYQPIGAIMEILKEIDSTDVPNVAGRIRQHLAGLAVPIGLLTEAIAKVQESKP